MTTPAKSRAKAGPGQWSKGQSGNPAGREKGKPNKATAEVKALAAEYGPEAVQRLAEIMRSPDEPAAARVAAAKELLDRAYGKATAEVQLTGVDGAGVIVEIVRFSDDADTPPE